MIKLKWMKLLTNFWLETRQPGFSNSVCRLFTSLSERIQKFKEQGNLKHVYKNELGKTCFIHDPVYPSSKDLAKRTIWNMI